MGMIMHDDVPYGEGTSYTQGTGIAINNNVIAVDADNTPTAGSEKPVKSKGVYEEIEQIYADNGVLGAKNLLKYPYDITAQTLNGMTLTADSNGAVTLNGTTTSQAEFLLLGATNTMLKVADMPSNLILKGSGSADYCNEVIYRDSNNGYISDQRAYNDDMELVIPSNAYYMRMAVLVRTNVTLSNAVLYPMLRLASDPDDTYVPYAMTNRELTEKVFEKRALTSGDDLNNITETGVYHVGVGVGNVPDSRANLMLIVDGFVTSQIRQILTTKEAIYTRSKEGITWSSWYKFSGTVVS